jgi:hypothetical protein
MVAAAAGYLTAWNAGERSGRLLMRWLWLVPVLLAALGLLLLVATGAKVVGFVLLVVGGLGAGFTRYGWTGTIQ